MSYSVTVHADSISPHGHRLVTIEATYPHIIHPQFLTHRAFSRNAASSRALPPEELIEQVKRDPFIPEFNRRVTGMGVGEPVEGLKRIWCEDTWRQALNDAIQAAERLIHMGVDKSRVNRLLEPFAWATTLFSATDWSNFFALRLHDDAQPEIQTIAAMMQDAYAASSPWECQSDCWHLPLVGLHELAQPIDYYYWKQVSVGRCARVSYLTHDGKRDAVRDVSLHNALLAEHHLSPFEHVARPFTDAEWNVLRETQEELRDFHGKRMAQQVEAWCRQLEYSGNFHGWHSYRADIPNQHDYSLVRAAA